MGKRSVLMAILAISVVSTGCATTFEEGYREQAKQRGWSEEKTNCYLGATYYRAFLDDDLWDRPGKVGPDRGQYGRRAMKLMESCYSAEKK